MIDEKKLIEIIKRHKKWVLGEEGGERADLRGGDLSGADLRWAYCRKQVEE